MARILIIDDDEHVREALAAVLDAAGHQTCLAADGNRALARLDDFNPDVVVTDILMPGMEGMETIHELRKRQPELPIVAMSGCGMHGGGDYLRLAERLGASQSLSKPVEPDVLVDTIDELLAGPKFLLR